MKGEGIDCESHQIGHQSQTKNPLQLQKIESAKTFFQLALPTCGTSEISTERTNFLK
jgi:hypothetical protein